MDYTVKTNIFRAKMANRNHLQLICRMMGRDKAQQWFQIYYPLLTDISNMQELEMEKTALKLLWPNCKDCQAPAVVWSSSPLNKWLQANAESCLVLVFRTFFVTKKLMCPFWN